MAGSGGRVGIGLGDVLYYPYVFISDRVWLASALLTYDRIFRLMPRVEEPAQVPDYVRLLADEGVVAEAQVTKQDARAASDALLRADLSGDVGAAFQLVRNGWRGFASLEQYEAMGVTRGSMGTLSLAGLMDSYEWGEPTLGRSGMGFGRGRTPAQFFMYRSNLTGKARRSLLDSGLAVIAGDYIGLRFDLARAYMTGLAAEVAKREAISVITSSPLDAAYFPGGVSALRHLVGQHGSLHSDLDSSFNGQLVVRAVGLDLPETLNQWPLRSNEADYLALLRAVLAIRRRTSGLRLNLQNALADISKTSAEALAATSGRDLKGFVDDLYRRTLHRDLERLQIEIRRSRLRSRLGYVGIQVALPPAVAAGLEATVSLDSGLTRVAAGASWALAVQRSIRAAQLDRQAAVMESPVGLLYVLGSHMQAKSVLDQIGYVSRRVLTGQSFPPNEGTPRRREKSQLRKATSSLRSDAAGDEVPAQHSTNRRADIDAARKWLAAKSDAPED